MQIVDLFIKRLSERLMDRDMTIEISDAAKDRLIELGWEPTLGARPLRRAVQHEIEDRLSEQILHADAQRGRPRQGRLREGRGGSGRVHLRDRPQGGRDHREGRRREGRRGSAEAS